MIKAKFSCTHVTKHGYGTEEVHLTPVYGKDGTANADWCKATPVGKLEMSINNPAAQGQIQPGKEYFLTIEEAPAETAAS